MIDVAQREPHDEKTPEETIARICRDWNGPLNHDRLAAEIIEALVYKAYFEESEGALRWLDQTDVLERIGVCLECANRYPGMPAHEPSSGCVHAPTHHLALRLPTLLWAIGERTVNDRWRVVQGRWGGWLVWRGEEVKAAFNTWSSAYRHAREEAALDNLGIISLEITS